ncbi:MAG: SH3 domain-containing protein [Bacteroidota bacterium]
MYKQATDQISFYTALMVIVGAFAPASLCLASSSSPSPALVFDSTFVKVTARVLNLRQAPNNQAPLVGQLQYGQIVVSKERRSNWHHIETDSLTGWAFAPFLTPTEQAPTWFKKPETEAKPDPKPKPKPEPEPDSEPEPEPEPNPAEQGPPPASSRQTEAVEKQPEPEPEPEPENTTTSQKQTSSAVTLTPKDIEQSTQPAFEPEPQMLPLHTITLQDLELDRWMEREEIINQLGEPTHASNTISIQHSKELLEYYTDDGRILYLYLSNGFLTHWQLYRPMSQR